MRYKNDCICCQFLGEYDKFDLYHCYTLGETILIVKYNHYQGKVLKISQISREVISPLEKALGEADPFQVALERFNLLKRKERSL